jgi:hypothetical protein
MMSRVRLASLLALLSAAGALRAAEADALAIARNIQARHLPYGTVLDPVLAAGQPVSYTRCGDSALWTGHFLAAESFHYAVTHSDEALANVRRAIEGLKLLTDVTGRDLLARCAVPADSPYLTAITSEEAAHGVYSSIVAGRLWFWIGETSRDQYSGAFFGLAAAYDFAPDAAVREAAGALIARLLDRLLDDGWNVIMPDGSISTTFLIRPDQQLTLLQIGRRVDVSRYNGRYSRDAARLAATTLIPAGVDAIDEHDSYFKFNIDLINFYSLLRLQGSGITRFWYARAYDILRNAVEGHGNAHFNLIDRALTGPNRDRDAETRAELEAWLKRPRTDQYVDYRGQYPACGSPDQACKPLPVELRVRTDFLWQRSPFQLYGGGKGDIETAGIDYLLPYWMGRYYGVIE